jgi:hypothetical protein
VHSLWGPVEFVTKNLLEILKRTFMRILVHIIT